MPEPGRSRTGFLKTVQNNPLRPTSVGKRRRRCVPRICRGSPARLNASDGQGSATWRNRNRVCDRGAGIAKFRLDRAGCPGTGGSDNQAASAHLVETAGLEPATSTFSIILRLRPFNRAGVRRRKCAVLCRTELRLRGAILTGEVARLGALQAISQLLRPVSGGGGCRESNPDRALGMR